MAYQSDGALQAKIARYCKILEKDPHSTVFVSLAETYVQLGRLDEALAVARSGVEGLPWFSPGHVILGQALLARGEEGPALGAFNKALTLDGECLEAFKGVATVFRQRNQLADARQVLERAAAIHPEDASVQRLLQTLSDAGEEDLETVAESAVPRQEEPDQELPAEKPIATTTIAELYVSQGLLTQACQIYRDILHSDPHNSSVRSRLIALEQRLAADVQAESAEEPEPPVQPAREAEILATLQRWLQAARLRRDYVQKHSARHC